MIQATQVLLPSGESISAEEILTGLLLLAQAEAAFPIMQAQDVHLAVLLLVPQILEYNNEHEII